ncbi:MAG: class I mannose-6-phosphate isomerase [Anaerolineales bacterium]|nr:class I mannose-6-phosphate isomerase [Anaerolineales bacterium]
MDLPASWRTTTQHLMPARRQETTPGHYNIYPSFQMGPGQVAAGYDILAARLAGARQVVIDGYPGVLWEHFRARLDAALRAQGVEAHWFDVRQALLPEPAVDALIAPSLGGDDPIFGFRYPGELGDFFDPEALHAMHPVAGATLNILYGCGAALAGWDGVLVYVDVPKNEIQFRQRAHSVTPLGSNTPLAPKLAYKRSYFVDWVVANRHKASLYQRIDWVVDEQRPEEITFAAGAALRQALDTMANNYFRVRPWFEPGPWGGQWLRARLPQLAQDVPNYAWSFELIVPENGLVFESDDWLLEVSFDFLMHRSAGDVTGDAASAFGTEFPIRFDLLDTFDGGNLSLQCHPRPDYVRRHFGERFTQDETYYMLESGPQARCFLGFQDNIRPSEYRQALDRSFNTGRPLDVEQYVQAFPVKKHDLILIPNGTIHCSGINNLVLEISATPYIFTFKMYDWQRMDLDGRPRPLNIDRAFDNLYFDRKGARVPAEFISHAQPIGGGPGWQIIHQPTHRNHFMMCIVTRFSSAVDVPTAGSCQIMSLVEGKTVLLETAGGLRQRFNYAETFVVPAAAGHFRLISEDGAPIKVVKSFVKPLDQWVDGIVG